MKNLILFAVAALLMGRFPAVAEVAATEVVASETAKDAPLKFLDDVLRAPELKKPVTFEAKSMALDDVLKKLAAQSGVVFQTPQGSRSASRLVTLRVRALPLADVLLAFRRLYGIKWNSQVAGTWTMQEPTDLEAQLLSLGDVSLSQPYQEHGRQKTKSTEWFDLALAHSNEATLNGDGFKVAGLPLQTKVGLRRDCEDRAAQRLSEAYAPAVIAALELGFLFIEPLPSPFKNPDGIVVTTSISFADAMGRTIAPLALTATKTPGAKTASVAGSTK